MPVARVTKEEHQFQVGILSWNDDNYIYFPIHVPTKQCLIIDPGESQQTIAFVTEHQLKPIGVVCTHHHHDHVDGAAALGEHFSVPVFCSSYDKSRLPFATDAVPEQPNWTVGPFQFTIIKIPGHTLGHMALYDSRNQWLFSGDTLFLYGCGRLFEGTAAQMAQSLGKLRNLPPTTQVFCGHEYTLSNLHFAAHLEPHNKALAQAISSATEKLATQGTTVPGLLGEELRLNPFLRFDEPTLQQVTGKQQLDAIEFFSYLRQQKNTFVAPQH